VAEFMRFFDGQESVARWFANVPGARTRETYSYALRKFVKFAGMSPDELVRLGRRSAEEAHDLVKMFYNSLELASKTKMTVYQAIRSFYASNHVSLGRKPRTFRAVVEYEPGRLYSQDEVAKLVDAADNARDKALITFLAQSGQRVGVITARRQRHINLEQPGPLVVDVPAVLRNKSGINVNKGQVPYRFAVGEDSKTYLKLMIRDRIKRGEPPDPDSWLFRSYSLRLSEKNVRRARGSEPGGPLSIAQVGKIVRDAAAKRDVQQKFGKRYLFHPHGFQRYWKHQLRMGGVDPGLIEYMMGHVLPYGGHTIGGRWRT
jgi:integrase/recombinase XerD